MDKAVQRAKSIKTNECPFSDVWKAIENLSEQQNTPCISEYKKRQTYESDPSRKPRHDGRKEDSHNPIEVSMPLDSTDTLIGAPSGARRSEQDHPCAEWNS